ncbi:hypothetical protein BSKO_05846 [Bryopsis sp. KO-2023]|nr:hypothetical protein BSKO_05846 [Bryopsis sp. KO-2023]
MGMCTRTFPGVVGKTSTWRVAKTAQKEESLAKLEKELKKDTVTEGAVRFPAGNGGGGMPSRGTSRSSWSRSPRQRTRSTGRTWRASRSGWSVGGRSRREGFDDIRSSFRSGEKCTIDVGPHDVGLAGGGPRTQIHWHRSCQNC